MHHCSGKEMLGYLSFFLFPSSFFFLLSSFSFSVDTNDGGPARGIGTIKLLY